MKKEGALRTTKSLPKRFFYTKILLPLHRDKCKVRRVADKRSANKFMNDE